MKMKWSLYCNALYFSDLETARKAEPAIVHTLQCYGATKCGGIVAKLNGGYTASRHMAWPALPLWKERKSYFTVTAKMEVYDKGKLPTNRNDLDDHKINYRVVFCDRREGIVVTESLFQREFNTLDEVQVFLEGKGLHPRPRIAPIWYKMGFRTIEDCKKKLQRAVDHRAAELQLVS